MRLFTIVVLFSLGLLSTHAQSLDERAIQACACKGMEQEVDTKAGTRVDCVSEFYAIEVEASQDWAEALGQSLHYAQETGKHAKVLFFCEKDEASCLRHRLIFESTVAHFDLPIVAEIVPQECLPE